MRREGKAGPFIPSEVRAHTGLARATMPAVARRRRRATRAVGARAKRSRSGGNACVQATTFAPVRRRVPRGRGVFSQTPQTSALRRRRLHPGDNVRMRPCDDGCSVGGVFFHKHPKLQRSGDNACIWATTSTLAPRRLDPGFETFAFFRALAIQTKLFHYLFLKITGTVLKMVIQSYSY